IDSLWRDALRSLMCATCNGLALVYPSWWSSARVDVVAAAANAVADDVLVRPRSWLLTQASDAECEATVVVEIAEWLVAVTGADVVGIPRVAEPDSVAEEVATVIAGTPDMAAVVLIDAPIAVAGASALSASIAEALRGNGQSA